MSVPLLEFQTRAQQLVEPEAPHPWQQVQPVHARAAIVCPAVGTSNTLVIAYTVPKGFSFVLQGIVCLYTGTTAPVEGDSDSLLYRLRANSAFFVRDFGLIATTLGSLTNGPYPIPGGVKLDAGTLLELVVTVPAASGIATGGINRIHGHLIGIEWAAVASGR
jgi:hypothetical protein